MTRARRWMAGTAVALLLLGGLVLTARLLLPSDEQIAAELSARFEKASGIALKVGGVHWSLRPSPVIVLSDLATAQARPITIRRIVVRPRLAALWHRSVAIGTVEVDQAVFPRLSVREFRGRWQGSDTGVALGGAWTLADIPVERLRLRDVTWIDRSDIALAYDADIVFDSAWRPHEADLQRHDLSPPARLHAERQGAEDRWRVLVDVAGGTWNGNAELTRPGKARLRLTASLEAKGVDIATLLRSFGRRAAIEGKADGQTTLDTEGDNVSDLLLRLHTRTRFDVRPAVLTGFDLAKAVSTAGISRGGRTPLSDLGGTLDTQATDDGTALRFSGLKARSGVLTASGSATLMNKRLSGEAAVDIVDGVVGVPLKISGTVEQPELSLTGGALAGAAVGTAVLPGVGTAIGARIGQQVEKIFGGGSDADKKPRRAQPAPGR